MKCEVCGKGFVTGTSLVKNIGEVKSSSRQKTSEWQYFLAWLAYSVGSFLAAMIIGGIIGFTLVTVGVDNIKDIINICTKIGIFLSMPIGYLSFRYIAMTIVNHKWKQ